MRTRASARRRAGVRVSPSDGGSVRAWIAVTTISAAVDESSAVDDRAAVVGRPRSSARRAHAGTCRRRGHSCGSAHTHAAQLAQVGGLGQDQEHVFERDELEVVALDPGGGDGLGRATRDLTVAPRRTDLGQDLARPVRLRSPRVRRLHASRCGAATTPASTANRRHCRSRAGDRPTPVVRTRPRAGRSPHGVVPTRPPAAHRRGVRGRPCASNDPALRPRGTSSHTHAEHPANHRMWWCGSGERNPRGSTETIPNTRFGNQPILQEIRARCAHSSSGPVSARRGSAGG